MVHSSKDRASLHERITAAQAAIRQEMESLPIDRTAGVGFRGMRERLRQLGGTKEIRSDGAGTAVTATLPLPDATPADQAKPEVV